MHILITGGTGLIGRNLINKLSTHHRFTVLTRSVSSAKKVLPNAVSYLESLDQLENLNLFNAVINLAGEPIADKRWSESQKHKICHSRWDITESLSQLIDKSDSPPEVFISGSAIGYYGRQGTQAVDEFCTSPHPEFTHDVCRQWEEIANRSNSLTRVCTLRTGIVLAKNGGALAKMRLPFKLGLGGRIGSGKQYMSWIHIDDMIAAIVFLLENKNMQGPFNLSSPSPVTNSSFTRTYARSLNRCSLLPMPSFTLKLLMGEAADLLLTGQRVMPKKLLDAGFRFKFSCLESALTDIELIDESD